MLPCADDIITIASLSPVNVEGMVRSDLEFDGSLVGSDVLLGWGQGLDRLDLAFRAHIRPDLRFRSVVL